MLLSSLATPRLSGPGFTKVGTTAREKELLGAKLPVDGRAQWQVAPAAA